MLTLTLRDTTAERLQRLAKARGLTVEETIEELIERTDERTQRQLDGIHALSGLLDLPDTNLAETDEQILHGLVESHDADSD